MSPHPYALILAHTYSKKKQVATGSDSDTDLNANDLPADGLQNARREGSVREDVDGIRAHFSQENCAKDDLEMRGDMHVVAEGDHVASDIEQGQKEEENMGVNTKDGLLGEGVGTVCAQDNGQKAEEDRKREEDEYFYCEADQDSMLEQVAPVCVYIYACVCKSSDVRRCVCVCVCLCVCVYIYIPYIQSSEYIHICIYIYIYIYIVCIYTKIYIHMIIYIYIVCKDSCLHSCI